MLSFNPTKLLRTITKPFYTIETVSPTLQIDNKPILENSIMIWDIENIAYSQFKYIKQYLSYTPQEVIVVAKKIYPKIQRWLERRYFTYYQVNTIADNSIIKLLKHYFKKDFQYFTIVSSDSDFAPIVKFLLYHRKKVDVISNQHSNRKLLFKLPLLDPDLKISAYEKIKHKKQKTNTNHKQPIEKENNHSIDTKQYYCDVCGVGYNLYPPTLFKNSNQIIPICRDCFKLFKKRFGKKEVKILENYQTFKKEFQEDMRYCGFYDIEKYTNYNIVESTGEFNNFINLSNI